MNVKNRWACMVLVLILALVLSGCGLLSPREVYLYADIDTQARNELASRVVYRG